MARKRSYRKMSKIEPAVQTMTFTFEVPSEAEQDSTTTKYLDLSQVASLVNRRFYRQGINWAVSGFKFSTLPAVEGNQPLALITASKLPDTWVMSNSWEKSFRVWQRMNNEALDETESVRPRFLDFKVYADSDHHQLGFGLNLMPLAFGGSIATPGEWSPSKVYIPTGTDGTQGQSNERELVAVGANYPAVGASGFSAVSLVEGYAASRGLPNVLDPNAPSDALDTDGFNPQNWMTAIFNEGTEQKEEILEDMVGALAENNIAPYPFENDGVHADTMYPNGANQLSGLQIHDFDQVTGTTIGGISRLKGGMFPCGLVRLDVVNKTRLPVTQGDIVVALTVDLVPGSHRGYLCEPMTEM
jgi:hypothetical protein